MRGGEFLDAVQGMYCTQLAKAAAGLAPGRRRVLFDVALRDNEGRAVGDGVLMLPLRVDLVLLSADGAAETISVDSNDLVAFDPVAFVWSRALRVELRPFHWDAATVQFRVPGGSPDWRPMVDWFRRWFRDDGGEHPLGVVHFLSDPVVDGETIRATVDFGSAPVDAFETLLDAIVEMKGNEVVIGRTLSPT